MTRAGGGEISRPEGLLNSAFGSDSCAAGADVNGGGVAGVGFAGTGIGGGVEGIGARAKGRTGTCCDGGF